MNFRELHYQPKPLLIGNVWDVASARIMEKLNYPALGTSSAAIAATLGYQDGEELEFEELEYVVRRIIINTRLPLSVDLEAGYSRHPEEIVQHIIKLAQLGVAGINLEDSLVNGQRELVKATDFSQQLTFIRDRLKSRGIEIFINVRTDAFLVPNENPVKGAIVRAKQYETAGADGIFVPGIEQESDIKQVVQSTSLPLNVMSTPNLPNFATLITLGVKRISTGNFVHSKLLDQFEVMLKAIESSGSFQPIFQ
ncbi:MAG: isocitrate lyase/phosphoenolpyruvate mutase family protein [Bacteroidota bacterium]